MMPSPLWWPPVGAVVVAHLDAHLDGATVHPRLPRDYKVMLPLVIVTRGPGSDDGITDFPVVDVEVFAATDDDMWSYAEHARQAMRQLRSARAGGVLVDTTATVVTPTEVPYAKDVHRAVASYRLALRQQPRP